MFDGYYQIEWTTPGAPKYQMEFARQQMYTFPIQGPGGIRLYFINESSLKRRFAPFSDKLVNLYCLWSQLIWGAYAFIKQSCKCK